MLARASLLNVVAAAAVLSLSSLASLTGCAADATGTDANDSTSDALKGCTKRLYVHVISYGSTDYETLLADKNRCWDMEAPKWSSGADWSICNATSATPHGGTRWAYDDINVGSATHSDASKILACKKANGGQPDIAYVAANSGGWGWSHAGIEGVERFFNECYDSDHLVKNRLARCSANGVPMWNIGASSNAYDDVMELCKSRKSGEWLGIYAPVGGLKGKEAAIVKALNACTTQR